MALRIGADDPSYSSWNATILTLATLKKRPNHQSTPLKVRCTKQIHPDDRLINVSTQQVLSVLILTNDLQNPNPFHQPLCSFSASTTVSVANPYNHAQIMSTN